MFFVGAHGAPYTDRRKRRFNGARSYIKRGNSPVQYRKYEKNMLPKHNQGAQMHSMHGRQNFEAYWNFSLTFPEVLASLPNSSSPIPPDRTPRFCTKKRVSNKFIWCLRYMFPLRKCFPNAFLRFISICEHLKIEMPTRPAQGEALRCFYWAFKIRSEIRGRKKSLACNKCEWHDKEENYNSKVWLR